MFLSRRGIWDFTFRPLQSDCAKLLQSHLSFQL